MAADKTSAQGDVAGESVSTLIDLPLVDCWNRIGINGDRSCPELARFTHCRDCPVFAAAARSFFDRPAPAGYLEDWSRWLAAPDELDPGSGAALEMHRDRGQTGRAARLFFRLGSEWLALDAKAIAEVVNPGPIHRVPHRSNQVFLGIMNLRGQIVLCVSLHGLLGIETHDRPARIVILRQSERVDSWAFPADEVAGIERVAPSAIHAAPTTLVNPAAGFGKAVIAWNGRTVDLLDEQRLQAALEGNCS